MKRPYTELHTQLSEDLIEQLQLAMLEGGPADELAPEPPLCTPATAVFPSHTVRFRRAWLVRRRATTDSGAPTLCDWVYDVVEGDRPPEEDMGVIHASPAYYWLQPTAVHHGHAAQRTYPCPVLCVSGLQDVLDVATIRSGTVAYLTEADVAWLWEVALSPSERTLLAKYCMIVSHAERIQYRAQQQAGVAKPSILANLGRCIGDPIAASATFAIDQPSLNIAWKAIPLACKVSFLMVGLKAGAAEETQRNWAQPSSFLLRHVLLAPTWPGERVRSAVFGCLHLRRFLDAADLWAMWCTGNTGMRRALTSGGGPIHPALHLLRLWWGNILQSKMPGGGSTEELREVAVDLRNPPPMNYTPEEDEVLARVINPSRHDYLAYGYVPYPRIMFPFTWDVLDVTTTTTSNPPLVTWQTMLWTAVTYPSRGGSRMREMWAQCATKLCVVSTDHIDLVRSNLVSGTRTGNGEWKSAFGYPQFRSSPQCLATALQLMMDGLRARMLRIRAHWANPEAEAPVRGTGPLPPSEAAWVYPAYEWRGPGWIHPNQTELSADQPTLPTFARVFLSRMCLAKRGSPEKRYLGGVPLLAIEVTSRAVKDKPPHTIPKFTSIRCYHVNLDTGMVHGVRKQLLYLGGYQIERYPRACVWLPETWANLLDGFATTHVFFRPLGAGGIGEFFPPAVPRGVPTPSWPTYVEPPPCLGAWAELAGALYVTQYRTLISAHENTPTAEDRFFHGQPFMLSPNNVGAYTFSSHAWMRDWAATWDERGV